MLQCQRGKRTDLTFFLLLNTSYSWRKAVWMHHSVSFPFSLAIPFFCFDSHSPPCFCSLSKTVASISAKTHGLPIIGWDEHFSVVFNTVKNIWFQEWLPWREETIKTHQKAKTTKWSQFCDELRKGCLTSDSNFHFIYKWIASNAANKRKLFLVQSFCHY